MVDLIVRALPRAVRHRPPRPLPRRAPRLVDAVSAEGARRAGPVGGPDYDELHALTRVKYVMTAEHDPSGP